MDVAADTRNLRINPGERGQTVIKVQNHGNIMDVFSVEVDGLDESWYGLSLSSASLFPGDNLASTLTIAIPEGSTATARDYPFSVKVRSQRDSSQMITLPFTLEVAPFYSFAAELNPESLVGAAGSYTLSINNSSNVQLTFELDAEGPARSLRFRFDTERPEVPAGTLRQVGLSVEPVIRAVSGAPRPQEFSLSISTNQGGLETEVISGRLDVRPWIPVPGWVIPSMFAVALAAVAAAVWLAVGWP